MCGLTIGLSKTGTLSVNDWAGQLMGQKYKVVHWLDRLSHKAEVNSIVRHPITLSFTLPFFALPF